jgi:HAD superfamily hydrolase (TIGR01549 family)
MIQEAPLILPRALLFDMDGTLTCPYLDFPRMKEEMGIPLDEPILEAMARMDDVQRDRASAILLQHEETAAAQSALNAGCRELLDRVQRLQIPTALITRNSRASVRTVLERHSLSMKVLITRQDGPAKPDPAPLRLACARLGVECADAWMIGDGRYDVQAALAAGARAVWLSHGAQRAFPEAPWRTVADLGELAALLQRAAGAAKGS